MLNKVLLYWTCQIGGWLFYGLSILLYSFTTEHNLNNFRYNRLAVGILLGFLFTHLLRTFIKGFHLRPPFAKNRWWLLLGIVMGTAYMYSITNSAFVEWFQLYNPLKKVSVQQRSLYNLLSDTPIIFAWTSFYYLWHYIEINTTSEIDKIRLESTVKDLELRTIKSHINPHFIFNALNSIRALVDENPERARTAITELSNILRSSMQVEKIEIAPFERELNIVKDYLALEHIRFEDRLQIEYNIDDDTLDQQVPPMMLQILVENAIKHGISKHKEGGLVTIISNFSSTHHQLIVENTGHLMEDYNHDGFGIASTENRLKLLYGKLATFEMKEVGTNLVQAKVAIPI
jgi:sensor histidine kinase YesM